MGRLRGQPLGIGIPPYFEACNRHPHSSFKRNHSKEAYMEVRRLYEEAWQIYCHTRSWPSHFLSSRSPSRSVSSLNWNPSLLSYCMTRARLENRQTSWQPVHMHPLFPLASIMVCHDRLNYYAMPWQTKLLCYACQWQYSLYYIVLTASYVTDANVTLQFTMVHSLGSLASW